MRRSIKTKTWLVMGFVVVAFALAAVPVDAVTSTDLDFVVKGGQVGSALVNQILDGPAEPVLGTLTTRVFFNPGSAIYTYEALVEPIVNNVSVFKTVFSVPGFNGVAGYSFSQALTASADTGITDMSTVFSISFIGGQLSWDVPLLVQDAGFWRTCLDPDLCTNLTQNEGRPMTFFYQSTAAPDLGTYTLINLHPGAAVGYAPVAVPEPGSLLLVGTGLVSAGLWRARRKAESLPEEER